jgi:catechol 2,3-dioxygenase-like lactoylglutathione lyase family enzyme
MLTRIDRVQVVVADLEATVAGYRQLLDAEVVRRDRVRCLAAGRTELRVGAGTVELLVPDGAGTVADFLSQAGGGLFAAGLATPDVDGLQRHLQAQGVQVSEESGQLFLAPDAQRLPGLRAVISTAAKPAPAGMLSHLYEVTLLVPDAAATTQRVAETFGLAPEHFVPIRSEQYGYDGTLTLFHPDRLDRLEVITPYAATKTMGRFFAKHGPALYMCFAEADDLVPLRERLLRHAPNDWTGPREGQVDSLFIHPKALGGMMMGVSRSSFAWIWSGRPDRVVPA